MHVPLQLPQDLYNQAMDVSSALSDLTVTVEDALSTALDDLCVPETSMFFPHGGSTYAASAAAKKKASGSSAAQPKPQAARSSTGQKSTKRASCYTNAALDDGLEDVFRVPPDLQQDLEEVARNFHASASMQGAGAAAKGSQQSAANIKAQARDDVSKFAKQYAESHRREMEEIARASASMHEAEAAAKGSQQSAAQAQPDSFSKQFAANLQRRLGGKKEAPAPSQSLPAVADVPPKKSTAAKAQQDKPAPMSSVQQGQARKHPAPQRQPPGSGASEGEMVYPEGMSKQERKRIKRKQQKQKAQQQAAEEEDKQQEAEAAANPEQPAQIASNYQQAAEQVEKEVPLAEANKADKGKEKQPVADSQAAEPSPVLPAVPEASDSVGQADESAASSTPAAGAPIQLTKASCM